jgi:phage terminase large subunit
MRATTAFKKILKLKHKNKVIQGSKGAGKTFSILTRWILMALKSENKQFCSVVSATFPQLRDGAIKDFETICDLLGIDYHRTKTPYTFQINNWRFNFFSVDKENKGLGGRRDRLFINEANRLDWKVARQLIGRTHKEVIFDFNPVTHFWAHKYFVDVNDCDFIKLTYKDNEELPLSEIESIEKHAPWGSVPDENYWRVYGLGEVGFIEGQIFKNYELYEGLPENYHYSAMGIDFGWEDPLTCIKVYVDKDKKHLYWSEMFYASQVKYPEFVESIKGHEEFDKNDVANCDHAPRDIYELRKLGIKAIQAYKAGGITERIRMTKQYKLFVNKKSLNLIRELENYKYQTKGDNIIDYPAPNQQDHAIDAAGYGSMGIIKR